MPSEAHVVRIACACRGNRLTKALALAALTSSGGRPARSREAAHAAELLGDQALLGDVGVFARPDDLDDAIDVDDREPEALDDLAAQARLAVRP